MTKNIGKADRIIRIIIGLLLIVASLFTTFWIGVLGVIVLVTGLLGWCGLYILIGVNTCPHEITNPAPTEITNENPPQD